MTDMYVQKTEAGLHGITPGDHEAYARFKRWLNTLPVGTPFKLSYVRERNVKHHRKFIVLCQVIAEYSEVYDTKEKAMDGIKLAVGHVNWLVSPVTGELVPIPKSISFKEMEQGDFEIFYDNAVNAAIRHLLPTMDKRSLDEAVERLIRF